MLAQTEETRKQNLLREQAKLTAAIAVVVSLLAHATCPCQESETASATNSNVEIVRVGGIANTSTAGQRLAAIRAI